MKKKISRIWGVGLTLMMVVSLLLWSAPVAADTLEWDTEDEPEEFATVNITDMVVSAGGLAIYVVAGTDTMYVSGDTGESWEEATIYDDISLDAEFVAVAPDDPQYVAAAGVLTAATSNTTVYITEDSGATWDSLGPVNELAPDEFVVMDVAVSMESGDNRYIAVAGVDNATDASVWYYEVGALGAEWTEITTASFVAKDWANTQEEAGAVAFSPNFNSDEILLVVTRADDIFQLEVFSFNTNTWNDDVGGFTDSYPLNLDTEGTTTAIDLVAADIAPSPDYLGSDDDLRQVFVGTAGAATGALDSDGIFFCDDDDVEALEKSELIHSVDFDGTNLVAGAHDGTTVFHSDDPLEGEDADVDTSSSSKSPGGGDGSDEVVVAFADGVVVAGTVGDDSAFSVSEDMGDNFNDITLIDGAIDDEGMLDFAVSADGSVKYLLTTDNISTPGDVSLWRLDNDLWERVRFFNDYNTDYGTDLTDLVIRLAPDDPDVIYLAEVGKANIYYSSDGGQSKWHNRTSRYEINDLAVETDGGIAYALTTSGYVSKSVNTGFTWGSKETTGQSGDYMIISLGEDMLLVGGDDGNDAVSYSTDGNESWTDLDPIEEGGNVQVTATGLADGDFIYAATDKPATTTDGKIYRWELGEDDEWDDDLGLLPTAHEARGIGLAGGILYVLSDNGTGNESLLTRFLDPSGDEEGDQSEAAAPADVFFDRTPTALRISIGSANLWAVDTASAKFYNYEDTVALIGPTLKSPSSGSDIAMNEISGYPADVNLVWESPSDEVTEFEVEIALDSDFDEGWKTYAPDGSWDEGDALNQLVPGSGLVPEDTYYWRVKVTEPVESPWSETWSFTVEAAEGVPPVTVEIPPTPEVTVTVPAPQVTVTVPPVVTVPPAPAPAAGWALITIIVIGALLVVALIVLILRTRRVV